MRLLRFSIFVTTVLGISLLCNARTYYDAVLHHLKGHVKSFEYRVDNGMIHKYEYNSDGKLMANDISDYLPTFSYNPKGYPVKVENSGNGTHLYTYDANNRLIKDSSNASWAYFYDSKGNLIRKEHILPTDTKVNHMYTIYASDIMGNPTDYTIEVTYVDTLTGEPIGKTKQYKYTAKYTYWYDLPVISNKNKISENNISKNSAQTAVNNKNLSSSSVNSTANQSSYFNVSGTIVNQSGKPVQGCFQNVPEGDVITTGTDGRFTLKMLVKAQWFIFGLKEDSQHAKILQSHAKWLLMN